MRHRSSAHHQGGYSLIELSMVLIIVGLLVAGVMKGNELIAQARMRNIASTFDNLAQAIYGYQERYRYLPGDDPMAQGRWPSNASNGDGNRLICGAYHGGSGGIACAGSTTESMLVWQHLRLAGLISGSGNSPLEHPGPGIFGIQFTAMGLSRAVICANGVSASIAGSIDRQFDDGLANQGNIRGVSYTGTADVPSTLPNSAAYVEEGSPMYVLCRAI